MLLIVSRDRFPVSADQWYISQATVLVKNQACLRRRLEEGDLDETMLDDLVTLDRTVPLREADCQADHFVDLLDQALATAADRILAVRVSEPRWAAVLRDYQRVFPTLQVLPGHDPLITRLTATCLRAQVRERRRVVDQLNARREWTAFSSQSGRGHVAAPVEHSATPHEAEYPQSSGRVPRPLEIASDGAHNPHRGTSWGYFTSGGTFRLGICNGSVAIAELHALRMALSDHPDVPLLVWTDSRRALAMIHANLRSGSEPVDRQVARAVRHVADLIQERREGGQEITLRWVHAHTEDLCNTATVLNDAADRLAKLALRRWCTPGLADGVEEVALSIAREAAQNLRDL